MVLVVMVAPCCGGRHIFYSGGPEEHMSLRGKQRRTAGNSHRPSENMLERGGDALAKLKYMTDGQDASHRCAHRLGGPDGDPFFIRASTQMDQDGPFVLA
jgi:hypothetical protein